MCIYTSATVFDLTVLRVICDRTHAVWIFLSKNNFVYVNRHLVLSNKELIGHCIFNVHTMYNNYYYQWYVEFVFIYSCIEAYFYYVCARYSPLLFARLPAATETNSSCRTTSEHMSITHAAIILLCHTQHKDSETKSP